ncbi:hypothetical protein TNCV_417481 [Trichonephila clavipes]|nr:hypothetical protein TNCV_417481 [Trichonephila clavipes]
MMQTLFPAGDGIFQDDNAPIHAVELAQSWLKEHKSGSQFSCCENIRRDLVQWLRTRYLPRRVKQKLDLRSVS